MFPRSRDAHREQFRFTSSTNMMKHGSSMKLYRGLIPMMLAAHYILSIVYRRLGMKDKAAHEAAMFADQKDDPMASTFALEFLRKHPEIASGGVPWHTHSDVGTTPAGRERCRAPGADPLNSVLLPSFVVFGSEKKKKKKKKKKIYIYENCKKKLGGCSPECVCVRGGGGGGGPSANDP